MEENNLRVWAIQIKGEEQDKEFGFNKYVWVTDKQAEKIMDLQDDDERKNNLVMACGRAFRIKDIASMRRLRVSECRNFASFDSGIIKKALKESEQENMAINQGNKQRLEESRKSIIDRKRLK